MWKWNRPSTDYFAELSVCCSVHHGAHELSPIDGEVLTEVIRNHCFFNRRIMWTQVDAIIQVPYFSLRNIHIALSLSHRVFNKEAGEISNLLLSHKVHRFSLTPLESKLENINGLASPGSFPRDPSSAQAMMRYSVGNNDKLVGTNDSKKGLQKQLYNPNRLNLTS